MTFGSTFIDEETKKQSDVSIVRTASKNIQLNCTLEELYGGAQKLVNVKTYNLAGEEEEKTVMVDVKPGSTDGSTFLYKTVGNQDPEEKSLVTWYSPYVDSTRLIPGSWDESALYGQHNPW